MSGQEEVLPEPIRHPGRESARDQQPAGDVEPDCGPIHHKIVADSRATPVGCHPLPQCSAFGDGHVHFGMTFHAADLASVGLFSGLVEKISTEKHPQEKDQDDDVSDPRVHG